MNYDNKTIAVILHALLVEGQANGKASIKSR